MSCKKILRNSYIPTKPRFFNEHDKGDLDTRLKQMTYNEILQNPEEHFGKYEIINFDLIHNECRGDELNHSREFYETLHKKKLDIEIENKYKNSFVSLAILCEGKDVYIEKSIRKEHFVREKLNKEGIYLSAMRKKKKCTDDCKSLSSYLFSNLLASFLIFSSFLFFIIFHFSFSPILFILVRFCTTTND